jgi:AcrR family transcriptional regulator
MTDATLRALLDERRPTRADARRNFDALVESAILALAEHGVDGSLEDRARRAGVGRGTR